MRLIILSVSLLFVIALSAQTDSVFHSSISSTYKSVNTLTRSDIERLPVFSFMQLVQGSFPFVGNESTVEEEYSFVVNGFILTNPNAINISQIESISFIPVGTNLTRGSLSKKGAFIINTRPEKNGFSFSTHTGWMVHKEHTDMPPVETIQTKNGFSTLNDLNYSHQSKKWFVSDALSFLKDESPHFRFNINSSPNFSDVQNTFSHFNRIRFSNFGGYQFDQHWSAEGGFFFTKGNGTNSLDRTVTNNFYSPPSISHSVIGTKPSVNYVGGNVGVNTNIGQIKNQLAFEIAKYKDNADSRADYTYTGGAGFTATDFDYHSNGYTFSDYFVWKPIVSSLFNLDISLLTRFRRTTSSMKTDSSYVLSTTTGPMQISNSGMTRQINSKAFSVSPNISINYKNRVFAEVGACYDTYGESTFGPNKKKKILPNAGARFEFASLLNNHIISTLEVAGSYSEYLTNFERYDYLGTQIVSNINPWPFGFSSMTPNPTLYGYPAVKNWVVSLAIGLHNDRFMFKAQYRDLEKAAKAYIAVPWYANFDRTTMIIEKLHEKGFCFEFKASIIEKEKKNWSIHVTAFQDKYSRQYKQYPPRLEDVVLMDAGKAPWRSGLKTSLVFYRIFMQASALINFNELAINKNGEVKDDVNRYQSNFLILGYTIPLSGKTVRQLRVSAESSGLFASKPWILAKYIGVGAQLNF